MDKDPNLDTVLQRIRDSYSKQTAALEIPISVIEDKLKAYKQAAKSDLLAEFLERNGISAGERRTEAAALALYEAMHELPEFRPVIVEVPEVQDDELTLVEESGASVECEWLTLKRVTLNRPVAIFGGYVLEDKLSWLADRGVQAEWVSNSNGSRAASSVQRLAAKIRNKSYCGVIVLNELISHDESNVMLSACRASGTLYAMGRKAGKGQLRLICDEFEKRIKEEHK